MTAVLSTTGRSHEHDLWRTANDDRRRKNRVTRSQPARLHARARMQDTSRGSRASRNSPAEVGDRRRAPARRRRECSRRGPSSRRRSAPHRGALACEDVTTPAVRNPGRTSAAHTRRAGALTAPGICSAADEQRASRVNGRQYCWVTRMQQPGPADGLRDAKLGARTAERSPKRRPRRRHRNTRMRSCRRLRSRHWKRGKPQAGAGPVGVLGRRVAIVRVQALDL